MGSDNIAISLVKIERRRAVDHVHQAIREAILDRRFPPRMRLNVEDLASQLGGNNLTEQLGYVGPVLPAIAGFALWERRRQPLARVLAITIAVATVIALVVGGAAAFALAGAHRTRRRGSWLLDLLVMLPLGVSAVTVGFGFLIALDHPPLDLRTSPAIIPIAHALIAIPFVVRVMLPVLQSIDPRLREAAAVLGKAGVNRGDVLAALQGITGVGARTEPVALGQVAVSPRVGALIRRASRGMPGPIPDLAVLGELLDDCGEPSLVQLVLASLGARRRAVNAYLRAGIVAPARIGNAEGDLVAG